MSQDDMVAIGLDHPEEQPETTLTQTTEVTETQASESYPQTFSYTDVEQETEASSNGWASWLSSKIDSTVDSTKRAYENTVKPAAASAYEKTKEGVRVVSTTVAEKVENLRHREPSSSSVGTIVSAPNPKVKQPKYDEEGNLIEDEDEDEEAHEQTSQESENAENAEAQNPAEPRIRKRDIMKNMLMENVVNPSKELVHKMSEETEKLRQRREEAKAARAEQQRKEAEQAIQYDEEGNVIPPTESDEGSNWEKVRLVVKKIGETTKEKAVSAKDSLVHFKDSLTSNSQAENEGESAQDGENLQDTDGAQQFNEDGTPIEREEEVSLLEKTKLKAQLASEKAKEHWNTVWDSAVMQSVRETTKKTVESAKEGAIAVKDAVKETVNPTTQQIAATSVQATSNVDEM